MGVASAVASTARSTDPLSDRANNPVAESIE